MPTPHGIKRFFYLNYMSIPIQQLRVGSYWQLNTKTGQVLKIVTPCEIADAAEYGIGIGLTHEVLIKLGFRQICNDYHYDKDINDTLLIGVYEDGIYLRKSGCSFEIHLQIKYLHRLQNLWYDLTGTELEYKP